MDFNNKRLIAKYKTWVGVQVAFYDFIFKMSIDGNINTEEFNQAHVEQLVDKFTDGERLYEQSVRKINELFETPEEAWEAFLNVDG